MVTLDQTLQDLVEKRTITREVAREKAKIPDNF
jgi:twitching motility protein PilT